MLVHSLLPKKYTSEVCELCENPIYPTTPDINDSPDFSDDDYENNCNNDSRFFTISLQESPRYTMSYYRWQCDKCLRVYHRDCIRDSTNENIIQCPKCKPPPKPLLKCRYGSCNRTLFILNIIAVITCIGIYIILIIFIGGYI